MSLIKKNNNRSEIDEAYLTLCNGTFSEKKNKFENLIKTSLNKYSGNSNNNNNNSNNCNGIIQVPDLGWIVKESGIKVDDAITSNLLEKKLLKYLNKNISTRISSNISHEDIIGKSICLSILIIGQYRSNIVLNCNNDNTTYTPSSINVQHFTEIDLLPVQESSFVIFQNLTTVANVVLHTLLFNDDNNSNNNVKNLLNIIIWLLSMSDRVKDFDSILFNSTFNLSVSSNSNNGQSNSDGDALLWKSFQNVLLPSFSIGSNTTATTTTTKKKKVVVKKVQQKNIDEKPKEEDKDIIQHTGDNAEEEDVLTKEILEKKQKSELQVLAKKFDVSDKGTKKVLANNILKAYNNRKQKGSSKNSKRKRTDS